MTKCHLISAARNKNLLFSFFLSFSFFSLSDTTAGHSFGCPNSITFKIVWQNFLHLREGNRTDRAKELEVDLLEKVYIEFTQANPHPTPGPDWKLRPLPVHTLGTN